MKHALIAVSLVAHALVIGWVMMPPRLEQVIDRPDTALAWFEPRLPCLRWTWIEHHSGCVVTREAVCQRSLDDARRRRRLGGNLAR